MYLSLGLEMFLALASARVALAQSQVYTYYYTVAIQAWYNNPTNAVPAQCPADHPVSCSSISQWNFCCPANNYCTWANSIVSCCPYGQTCYGAPLPQAAPPPPPATFTTTTTGFAAVGGASVPTTTTTYGQLQRYCSTLTAQGASLPTARQGDCGTILIVSPSEAGRLSLKRRGAFAAAGSIIALIGSWFL